VENGGHFTRLPELGHQRGDVPASASAEHRGGDLEGEGQVAAQGGQLPQCLRFAGGAVVAFVGVVQGVGDEGGALLGVERSEVDDAYGESVRAVPGGDEDLVVVGAGQEREELRGVGRVVQDQQHPVLPLGEQMAVGVVPARRSRWQIRLLYAQRVEQGQDRLVRRDRVVVVAAQVHEQGAAGEPAPRTGPVRRLQGECRLADAAQAGDGGDHGRALVRVG
jgi:hypothetical protein